MIIENKQNDITDDLSLHFQCMWCGCDHAICECAEHDRIAASIWESHFDLLESVETAYRNYATLKAVFGAESKITKAALVVWEATQTFRAALLEQITNGAEQ